MPWTIRMTLFVFAIAAPFSLYTGWKAIAAGIRIAPTFWVRWAAIALAGWWCLFPFLLMTTYFLGLTRLARILTNHRSLTDWVLVYPFWTGAIIFAQAAPLLLLLDLVRFSQTLVRTNWTAWSAAEPILVLTALIATTGFVVYRIFSDTSQVKINSAVLAIEGLPARLEGLRIVHVSDLQADPRTTPDRQERYVEAANSLAPDLVLFSGDLVTSGTDFIEEGAVTLGQLKARLGVYACLGDHDIWSDADQVIESLRRNGIRTAHTEHVLLEVDGEDLDLSVLTNAYSDRPDLGAFMSEKPDAAVSILLTHQPTEDVVERADQRGYDLTVAGHTHGGQIVVGYFGWTLTPVRTETQFLTGFYRSGRMLLSVNNGLGLTLAPFRYGAPAEVTLIELKTAETDEISQD